MKTVICDDEKSTCSELEEIILKYAKEKSVSLVTEVFYSGDTLLDYLKREKINILFLDIDCLLYTSPSPRDGATSRMPSSA